MSVIPGSFLALACEIVRGIKDVLDHAVQQLPVDDFLPAIEGGLQNRQDQQLCGSYHVVLRVARRLHIRVRRHEVGQHLHDTSEPWNGLHNP